MLQSARKKSILKGDTDETATAVSQNYDIRKAERSVKDGHPWIYGEEILKTEANSKTAVWWMCLPETPLWDRFLQ